MARACVLCSMEIGNTSLVFKKSDLTINSLLVPNQMTEKDVVCVNCFNQILKNPKTNTNKARIDILVNILEKEMDKNNVDIDSILEKMDIEMNKWSLSEPVKTAYLVEVMDIIEVAIYDESSKRSAINQIRKILSLNFDVKPRYNGIRATCKQCGTNWAVLELSNFGKFRRKINGGKSMPKLWLKIPHVLILDRIICK